MKDGIVRALLCGGEISCIGACTGETVGRAGELLGLSPQVRQALGKLLTAGALIAQRVKDNADSLTLIIDGNGPAGRLLVTAHGDGTVKGYAQNPDAVLPMEKSGGEPCIFGTEGTFTMVRAGSSGQPYSGMCPLVSGEVSEILEAYFATSEQLPAVFLLSAGIEEGAAAGGLFFTAMPGCGKESLEKLGAALQELGSLPAALAVYESMAALLEDAFAQLEAEILEEGGVSYHCDCSRERMEAALLSLGEKELKEMAELENGTEICCHFCNGKYIFTPLQIEGLLCKRKAGQ